MSKLLASESGLYALTGYDVTLLIHQAAALVERTGTLARLAKTAASSADQIALITGAFLTAAAAAEAILSESAHDHAQGLYGKKAFRRAGAPAKYLQLLGEPAPELLERIWMVRTALTHSEPQNPRSGAKGEHMTAEGAVEVAQFVQDLAARVKARLLPPKP